MANLVTATGSGDEWLQARTRGLGGSDAVTLMGAGEYEDETPFFVWLKKTEAGYDIPDNPAMERGRALEPLVIQQYMDDTGNTVVDTGMWQHAEHPVLIGSPDGLVVDPDTLEVLGGFEAKTTLDRTARTWDGELPPRYEWQSRHYMAIMGVPWWDVTCLVVDTWEVLHWRVWRDEAKERALIAACEGFWETYVVPGIPPEPEGVMASLEAYHRWPEPTQARLELTSDQEEGWVTAALIEERNQLKAYVKSAEERLEGIDSELKVLAADHETVLLDGQPVYTWKAQSRESLDAKRLRADHPELAAEYARTSSFRVLRVK